MLEDFIPYVICFGCGCIGGGYIGYSFGRYLEQVEHGERELPGIFKLLRW